MLASAHPRTAMSAWERHRLALCDMQAVPAPRYPVHMLHQWNRRSGTLQSLRSWTEFMHTWGKRPGDRQVHLQSVGLPVLHNAVTV